MIEQTIEMIDAADDVTGFHWGGGYAYNTFAYSPRTYVVQPGDSLSLIAARMYGNAAMWPALYAMNSGSIYNPNLIFPGQVLVLG